MTCNHASGGCDYPAGECAGSCLQQSTREGWGHVADLEVECKALRDCSLLTLRNWCVRHDITPNLKG